MPASHRSVDLFVIVCACVLCTLCAHYIFTHKSLEGLILVKLEIATAEKYAEEL